MQKIFRILIFVICFIIISATSGNISEINAETCTISLSPSTGNLNTGFTATGNCNPPTNNYYFISIFNSDNDVVFTPQDSDLLTFDSNGNYTFTMPPLGITGTFTAVISAPLNPLGQATFTINEDNNTSLQCGDTTSTYSPSCPNECPSVMQTASSWYCGGQPQVLDCSVGDLGATNDTSDTQNVQALDARACIGGFTTREQLLQPIRIKVNCLDKSGLVHLIGDQCAASQEITVTPTANNIGTEDSNGDGVDDNFYTCFDIQEINRDVGKIDVEFTTVNRGSCTTQSLDTLPANYDFWYEHIRRQFEDNDGYNEGENLYSPICADGGINTAIGCINYDVVELTQYLLGWSIGVGGGVALVLIVYAGIQIMTSMGDPGRLAEAKSLFFAAISGLLLIILSTFILRFLGVNILELF